MFDSVPLDVILIAGQSNCHSAPAIELTLEEGVIPQNVEYWEDIREKYGLVRVTDFRQRERMGMEVTLSRLLSLEFPERKFLIIKFSRGGTGMNRWNPDTGDLYPRWVATIKRVVEGRTVNRWFLNWWQGESESNQPSEARLYRERTLRMFNRLAMKDLAVTHLLIQMAIIDPNPSRKCIYPVVADQLEILFRTNLYRSIKGVSVIGTERMDGGLHLTVGGQRETGRRFFNVMFGR